MDNDQLRAVYHVRANCREKVSDYRSGQQAAEMDQKGGRKIIHDWHTHFLGQAS